MSGHGIMRIAAILGACVVVLWCMASESGGSQIPVSSSSDAGVEEGRRRALKELQERADAGDGISLFRLAMLHEEGYDTIAVDSLRAEELYRKSAEAGYVPAMNQLGFMLMHRKDSRAEGLRWLEKGAMGGDAKACSNLGWLLMRGDYVERDYGKAAFWLEKGVSRGLPVAMSLLGDMCSQGLGMPADTLRADSLYSGAFEAGLRDAGYRLAELRRVREASYSGEEALRQGLYFYLRGVPSVGIRLFRNAAQKDVAQAMALLGDAYARGMGVEYDHALSGEWFARAAAAGDPSAAFYLAELFEMFPDALDDVTELPSRDPSYWYSVAEASGVCDSATAARRLMELPSDLFCGKRSQ